jgi:hypothetical protein
MVAGIDDKFRKALRADMAKAKANIRESEDANRADPTRSADESAAKSSSTASSTTRR